MVSETNASKAPEPFGVEICRRLAKHLEAGRIDFEDYAYNFTINSVNVPYPFIEECVNEMPKKIIFEYIKYLDKFIVPVDFMPCPSVFLANKSSAPLFEYKKQELRPKYIRLYELAKKRAI